jgi:hypothetical protein
MFPKVTARLCHITAVLGESLGDAAQDPIVGDLAVSCSFHMFRDMHSISTI